jgi:hypothetical protein
VTLQRCYTASRYGMMGISVKTDIYQEKEQAMNAAVNDMI